MPRRRPCPPHRRPGLFRPYYRGPGLFRLLPIARRPVVVHAHEYNGGENTLAGSLLVAAGITGVLTACLALTLASGGALVLALGIVGVLCLTAGIAALASGPRSAEAMPVAIATPAPL